MKHKQQLKTNFLAGQHNMKQCPAKNVSYVLLLSITMCMPTSGMTHFPFDQYFFLKMFHITRIIAKLKKQDKN